MVRTGVVSRGIHMRSGLSFLPLNGVEAYFIPHEEVKPATKTAQFVAERQQAKVSLVLPDLD